MTHPTDAERMRDKCAAHLHALLAHEQDMVVRALEVRPISTESLRDAMYRAGTCEGYRLAEAAIRALPASDGAANDEAARGRVRTDAGRLVGALLDAWDGVPNDERPPKLERPFRAIYAAIEDETFYATPAPSRPAAPAPTRPRVSTAGSGQEARLVVTPAAPSRPADDGGASAAKRGPTPDDAGDAVRAATERVVKAWTRMDKPGAECDLHDAVEALYEAWTDAAERAQRDAGASGDQSAQDAKGGATTGAPDCDDDEWPEFTCPMCGSHYYGTSNCTSPKSAWMGHCHGPGCKFSWPRESDDAKYFNPRPTPARDGESEGGSSAEGMGAEGDQGEARGGHRG